MTEPNGPDLRSALPEPPADLLSLPDLHRKIRERRDRRRAAALLAIVVVTAGTIFAATRSGSAPSAGTAMDPQQTADRTRLATEFAQTIAGNVPVPAGARDLAQPPPDLFKPGEVIGVPDLIVQARYWTTNGTPFEVYNAMRHSHSAYELTGHGAPGEGSDPANQAFLSYSQVPKPGYLQDAEVHVQIQSLGTGQTVVASFGEVAAYPVKAASETIAEAGAIGTYTWPRIAGDKVIGHTTASLQPDVSGSLIRAFNRSPVADGPDACFGGLQLAGDVVTVHINSDGSTWKLVDPGTSCEDVSVMRDGQSLPAIQPTRSLRLQLQILEHVDGYVVGHLLAVGGPAGAAPTPESGTITASGNGTTVTTHSHGSGDFGFDVLPGSYTLSATSPHYRINGVPGTCMASHAVAVTAASKVRVNIYCQRR